jgi:hypothetical protein
MTNTDRTIARLERQMKKAVMALMKADAGLRSCPSALIAPKSWGWPRADDFGEMIRSG